MNDAVALAPKRKKSPSNPPKAGEKIGAVTLIRQVGETRYKHRLWECRCECGNLCVKSSNNLTTSRRTGVPASCGCLVPKLQRDAHITHGMRNSREYRAWMGAKARCFCPTNKNFVSYGARGITVCAEWAESFERFYADMGPCPPGLTLDRIDCNGNYEPGNCRWTSQRTQQQNKRNGYRWFIKGCQFDSITDASAHFGVSLPTIVRWCEGYFDKRRGQTHHPRPDCHREQRYA